MSPSRTETLGALGLALVLATALRLWGVDYGIPHPTIRPDEERAFRGAARATGGVLRAVAKNLAGIALIVVGVALSLPGVPGQGVLTVLVGVMLLDIPGKKRLERRIVAHPKVLASMNRLRDRFGREPLRL